MLTFSSHHTPHHRDLELAESLREGAEGGASADWSVLGVGSCVAGCVHVKVDYGLLVDLEANEVGAGSSVGNQIWYNVICG